MKEAENIILNKTLAQRLLVSLLITPRESESQIVIETLNKTEKKTKKKTERKPSTATPAFDISTASFCRTCLLLRLCLSLALRLFAPYAPITTPALARP